MMGAGAVGVLGLLGTFAGMASGDARPAFFSYLFAFVYWGGIALASGVLLQIFHAFRAKGWGVWRGAAAARAAPGVLSLVLSTPRAVGLKHLSSWADPAAGLPREALKIPEHKKPYLNTPF